MTHHCSTDLEQYIKVVSSVAHILSCPCGGCRKSRAAVMWTFFNLILEDMLDYAGNTPQTTVAIAATKRVHNVLALTQNARYN